MSKLLTCFGRFGRARRGGVMIEFAFVAPILLTIILSGFEFGRYVLISTKLDRAVTSVGDMATQSAQLTSTDLSEIFNAASQVLEPFELAGTGNVIVSHVKAAADNDPRVTWQVKGVGTATTKSEIGDKNQSAELPSYMTLEKDETVVVVELNYAYKPMLFDLVWGPSQLYRVSYHRPRKSEEIAYSP